MSDSLSHQIEQTPTTVRQDGLSSRSYLGLWLTQFLGTINDNAFRWLAVPIGKMAMDDSSAVALGLASFTIPYLIFTTPAAYLADRYSKRTVIVGCKIAEVVLMLLGVLAIWLGSLWGLFAVVFLMGTQSALFSPSKFGSIPEILKPSLLSKGNGLMGMGTIIASAIGFVIGMAMAGYIGVNLSEPVAISELHPGPAALMVIGLAVVGVFTSLMIRPLPVADPDRPLPQNPVTDTWQSLNQLWQSKALFRAALGTAFFWFLASLAQVNIDAYGSVELALKQEAIGPLLAILVVGVGAGSVLAGVWSGDHVELGIVPLGAIGIAVSSILLFFVGSQIDPVNGLSTSSAYNWSSLLFLVLGIASGLYNIPLDSFLQHRSPPESRGRILAATNFLCFTLILGSSGLFWLLRNPWGFSPSAIFLMIGLATIPVAFYICWLLPQATIRFLVWLLTHTLYKVRVSGKENLPATGGALLVANHVSWLDGLYLLVTSSRPIRMIAYAEYVEKPYVRWLSQMFGIIPIKASDGPKALMKSLQTAKEALKNGELVCIFAEGQLTRTGQLGTFQGGMLRIIKGTDAPVIPIYLDQLWGSIFSFHGGKFFWKWPGKLRYPVSVCFGKPICKPGNVQVVRNAVQNLGVESMQNRKSDVMVPVRSFVRECRNALSRQKAVDSTGASATGARLLMGSVIFKRIFTRKGIGQNQQMLGVMLPPSVGGSIVNTAVTMMSKVAVNLNYTLSDKDVNYCIKQCDIKQVITSRLFLKKKPIEFDDDVELIYMEDLRKEVSKIDKLVAAFQTYLVPVFLLERIHGLTKQKPDDLLTIIFTSGSTGNPKGVELTNFNVATNIDAATQVMHFDKNDTMLGVLPFFHSFGFTALLWLVMSKEPKAVYHHNPVESKVVGELCEEHKVTVILTTPTFLKGYMKRCKKEQFKYLDLAIVGAEKLPQALAEEFHQKFGITPTEGYGTTELSPLVSCNVPDHRSQMAVEIGTKMGTVGRAVPNVSVKVVDPDTLEDFENPTTEHEGMLMVSGPNVMRGYLKEPEKTDEVIRDGWYVTGDIARIDEDGFIQITGRLSRFSKIAGEMVPHIKIEEILRKIVENEDDEEERLTLAVTAVPDEKKGERLVVVHLPLSKPAAEVLEELSETDIPNLWLPARDSFLEVDDIPVLGTGKLDLRGLKQLALDHFCSVGAS